VTIGVARSAPRAWTSGPPAEIPKAAFPRPSGRTARVVEHPSAAASAASAANALAVAVANEPRVAITQAG
jgi:hypothetical protein